MARIAIAVAGAVIGGIIGGPLGAQIGFALGNVLGAALFPPKLPTNYGPRLNDRQIMSSADGEPIPWGYGGFRLGGNVIYAQKIKETTTKQKQSAKGGPTQTSITYTYSATFAVAFCEGPADVLRIWADSKLIYDSTGKTAVLLNTGITDNGLSQTVSFSPLIYKGTNDQMPDPTIQADRGIPNTPAFRGICYVMFVNFPLADFGNRIPNIRAELSSGQVLAYTKNTYPNPHIGGLIDPRVFFNSYTLVDKINRIGYLFNLVYQVVTKVDLNSIPNQPLLRWQANHFYQIGDQILDSNGFVEQCFQVNTDQKSGATEPVWPIEGSGYAPDNHVYWANVGKAVGGDSAPAIIGQGQLDPRFGAYQTITAMFGNSTTQSCIDGAGYIWAPAQLYNGTFTRNFLVRYDPTNFKAVQLVQCDSGVEFIQAQQVGGKNLIYCISAGNQTPNGMLWVFDSQHAPGILDGSNGVAVRQGYIMQGGVKYDVESFSLTVNPYSGICYIPVFHFNNIFVNYVGTWGFIAIDVRGTGSQTFHPVVTGDLRPNGTGAGILFDQTDNTLLHFTGWGVGGAFGDHAAIYKTDLLGNILATSNLSTHAFYGPYSAKISKVYNGIVPHNNNDTLPLWNFNSSPVEMRFWNTATLELVKTAPASNWLKFNPSTDYDDSFDNVLDAMLTGIDGYGRLLYLDRKQVDAQDIGDVVTDLLLRADIPANQIDVSQIAGTDLVLGYAIARTSDAKACLEPLTMAYFFDLVETDFKIKAVPRGGASAVAIPESDLGISSDKYKLQETIAQEQDLPKDISIQYYDPALNYQQGHQRKYRKGRVKKTKNKYVVQLPIAFQADSAAQIAEKYLETVWAERNQYEFKLWKSSYLKLDPTDVVTFGYENQVFAARMTKESVGKNFVMEISTVSEDARNYISSAKGGINTGFNGGAITANGPTLLFLLDIPLLQDIDASASGNTGFYWVMSVPSGLAWPGGVLYSAPDDATWTSGNTDTVVGDFAYVLNTLGAPPSSPYSWDFVNTITVRMVQGIPASTSLLNVLNGANALYMNGEIIQFANSVLNGDGSYTLSTLLRGRRGTESFCGTHVTAETAIFLTGATVEHTSLPTSAINALSYYRGVTIGNTIDSANSQQFTPKGNDLKPYAPASLQGSRY